MSKIISVVFYILIILVIGCEREELVVAEYNTTPYNFTYPENFGDPELPAGILKEYRS